jgi:hypothetical protein
VPSRTRIAAALGALMLPGLAYAQAPGKQVADTAVFDGVKVVVQESAHDNEGNEKFEVALTDPRQRIDLGSILTIRFLPQVADGRAAPDERWEQISKALQQLGDLQAEYLRLAERAKPLGTAPDADFRAAVQSQNKRVSELLQQLTDPKSGVLTRESLNTSVAAGEGNIWEILISAVNSEKQKLYANARTAPPKPAAFVVVRGYRLPKGSGETHRVHVNGYDNLQSRSIVEADLQRGLPSARELARLQAQLAGSQLVADAVSEIQDNGDKIRSRLRQLIDDTGAALKAQLDAYVALAGRFDGADDLLVELRGLVNNTKANDIAARIDTLRTQAKNLRQAAEPLIKRLEPLRDGAASARVTDIIALFQAIEALRTYLPTLSAGVDTLGNEIGRLPGDLEALIAELGQQASQKLRTDADKLSGNLKAFATAAGKNLLAELPKTKKAIDDLLPQLAGLLEPKDSTVAIAAVSQSGDVIPRPLDKLLEGTIDLRSTDIELGDKLDLRVSFVGAKADGSANLEDELRQFIYTAAVVHTGWYREFSGDLIFARALKGDSRSFKPNVAASMEWHYFDRQSPDGLLNNLNPGFGLHAANLDQSSSQNVELGAGVNGSLFGGLLRIGYGWNLSVSSHRQYAWIGLGLFGALNKLNVVESPPRPTEQ